MKILITAAVMTASLTFGSASAADLRPEALGCYGFTTLQASAERDPKQTDGSGGDLTGRTMNPEMAAGLIKSGECFSLTGSTIKELNQYRIYASRIMAVLPEAGAVKLWAFYYHLHNEPMPHSVFKQVSFGRCVNDCRD